MKNNSSRKLLFTMIAIVVLTLLSAVVINLFTNKKDVTDWLDNVEFRYLVVAVIVICCVLILLAYLQFRYAESSDKEKEILTENIEPDVKKLFDSLKERYQKRYENKLDERFEIKLEVSEDWDGRKTQTFNERYDKDAKISEAFPRLKELFDSKDGLLIVGEPGAGKTVLLLKVALNLLGNTNLKEKEPFPVIFNLASWNKDYANFGEWLKAMLVSGNGLSKDFAERLLREKRFILLLDGLDELARNEEDAEADQKRAACLESLNNYLDGEKTVICCRIDEFAAMQKNTAQDAPVSAKIKVLNLTEVEIFKALGHAQTNPKHHASAKNVSELIAKDENAALRKILCTPFYFTIALEVFYKRLSAETNLPHDEKELGTYLIEKYVERKLDKTSNPNNFDKEKTKKWLKWLAELMEKETKQLITFELADLHPADLTKRWFFGGVVGLFVGLLVGLVGGLVFGLVFGLIGGLVFGLVGGLIFGLVVKNIKTEDIVKMEFTIKSLKKGLVGGLVVGLIVGLVGGLFGSLFVGLVIGLVFGLVGVLFGGLEELKKINQITYLENPYQRLYGGFIFNFLLMISVFTLFGSFLSSLNYFPKLQLTADVTLQELLPAFYAVVAFPIYQLFTTPIFLHSYLRFCFWYEGAMPLKYATFLDYAAEARILEKDGGQWRFRHQNLQEYFAKLTVSDK